MAAWRPKDQGAVTCLQRVAQALGELDDGPVQHGVKLAGPRRARRPTLLLRSRRPHGHQGLQALQEGWRRLQGCSNSSLQATATGCAVSVC